MLALQAAVTCSQLSPQVAALCGQMCPKSSYALRWHRRGFRMWNPHRLLSLHFRWDRFV